MTRSYVSNKDESARLFKSDFLEMFTHVHPTVPLVVYLPVIGYLMYLSAMEGALSPVGIGLMLLAGVFIWTLTEYLLHRFVFHYEPTSDFGKWLHFMAHGVHHDYPNDSLRLVMPPVVSIPLALLFYSLFNILLGQPAIFPFFAGFLAGYLYYDMLHYATHHFSLRSKVGQLLKHHHMRHHYQNDRHGFGVSSPLWDYVFRTTYPKK